MAVGKIVRFSVPVAINQDLKALYPNERKVDGQYFFYAVMTCQRVIESKSSGSTVKGIRLEDLRSIKIPAPEIEIQKNLGCLLRESSRKLKLLERRAEMLKAQKQGLMQKLLTGKVRVKV